MNHISTPRQPSMNQVTFSIIKAISPDRLSKRLRLGDEGQFEKHPGGHLVRGTVEKASTDWQGFASALQSATPSTAFVFGVPEFMKAVVVTQSQLQKLQKNAVEDGMPVVARDRAHFHWSCFGSVLVIDYDPVEGLPVLDRNQFLDVIFGVFPALRYVPYIWRPSCSSCIYNSETGVEARGIAGQRLYIFVACGSDIPRAGKVLAKRLWLAGYGTIVVSKSGAKLERTIVDICVLQPEHLDYCGGAECEYPLIQKLPPPEIFNPDAAPADTRNLLPDLTMQEEQQVEALKAAQKGQKKVQDESAKALDAWLDTNVQILKKAGKVSDIETTKETLKRAAMAKQLEADFPIQLENGQKVMVGELLENPTQYHGSRCADPLEPEYRNDIRVAYINLKAKNPYIYSHAHGGCRYLLIRQKSVVQIINGELDKVVRCVLDVLSKNYSVYERGGELVYVNDNGKIFSVTQEWLAVHLTQHIYFERFDGRREDFVPVDCPAQLAKSVLAMRGQYGLPHLKAVLTAPIMTLDGRILDEDGYDQETGLLLMLDSELPPVPRKPTPDDVREALRTLNFPFKDFPFVSQTDLSVLMSALLTATIRAVLPTAPGFLLVAPTAGSGKTLISICLSILAGSEEPTVMPPTAIEEELRKRLLAALREGKPAVLLDNIVGQLDSATLCALLTSKEYSDRLLGSSVTLKVPTTTMVMASGNNVTLVGDLNRRFLTCSIDPKTDRAYRRSFNLNPASYVQEHRQEMVRAVLTILQGYRILGQKMAADRTASFEDWSDLVRQAVIWAGTLGVLELCDPCNAIDSSYGEDPESHKLQALLESWHAIYKSQPRKVQQIIHDLSDNYTVQNDVLLSNLYDAVDEIAGEHGHINVRRLGRWIEKMKGRICNNKKFVISGRSNGSNLWSVQG